jgi:hypothetical protein
MFRASSCPSSGATRTAVAASGFASELGDSSAGTPYRSSVPSSWDTLYIHTQPFVHVCAFQLTVGRVEMDPSQPDQQTVN